MFLVVGNECPHIRMDCRVHIGNADVWELIAYNQEHNLPLPDGANLYLGYCKHNGVTRSKLQKAVGYEGMNVLPLYDPKADKQKISNTPTR